MNLHAYTKHHQNVLLIKMSLEIDVFHALKETWFNVNQLHPELFRKRLDVKFERRVLLVDNPRYL